MAPASLFAKQQFSLNPFLQRDPNLQRNPKGFKPKVLLVSTKVAQYPQHLPAIRELAVRFRLGLT